MSNEFRIKKGLIVNETDFYVSGSKAGFGTITPSSPLEVYGSGSTVFSVNGASGQLFGVSDDLTDSLFSVNTIAGLPVIEAFADNTVKIGTFGNEELIVSESQVSIISASIYGPTYLEGNVGIGTTSPTTSLHVAGPAYFEGGTISFTDTVTDAGIVINEGDYIYTRDGNNLRRLIGKSGSDVIIVGEAGTSLIDEIRLLPGVDGPVTFYSGSSEYARFDAGRLGIGTTSPDVKLQVEDSAVGTNIDVLQLTNTDNSTGAGAGLEFFSANAEFAYIRGSRPADTTYGHLTLGIRGTGDVINIRDEGNVGIGTTSPSFKLHLSNSTGGNGSYTGGILVENTASDTGESVIAFKNAGSNGTGTNFWWNGINQQNFYTIGYGTGVTDGNTKLVIDETSGNVGIGIINPTAKLHVSGTIADNREFQVGDDYLVVTGSNGYVGIGTTSPSKELTVQGEISSSGGIYSEGAVQADTFRGDQYPTNSFLKFNDDQDFASNMATLGAIGAMNFIIDTNDNDSESFTWWHGSTDVDSATQLMDLDENGNLTVTGIITAQEFHTEFVSASIIYQSGSTKFGDTSDDVHSFSGSLRVTGSGDHYFTDGNVGIGTTSPSYKLDIQSGTGSSDRVQLRLKNNGTGDGDAIIYLDSSAGGESDIDFMHDGSLNWRLRTGDASQATNTNFNINNASNAAVLTLEQGGNVGIGTTSPSTKLEVNGDSKFQDLLTVANDIYPETNYVSNIGAINKKFLTLNVAELIVETLVASERRSTVGGRFNVGISTQLSQSISPASSSILVENNNLNPGDIIHLEGGTPAGTPQVEFMKVTSTASSGSGDGFSYTVDRNLDGTGANTWEAGSGVFNTGVTGSAGQSGTGFIDQYAINSLTTGVTTAGPTIAFMERTGSAFPDIDSRAVVGNLKGWYGYGTDIFGFASGDYKAQNITVDPFNGLRIRNVGDIQLQASSSFLSIGDDFLYDSNIGRLFVSGSNIDLVSPSFFLGGTTQYVSGSGGSIEISGSNFHLLNGNITASNVDLSGNINAQTGTIGGFTISTDALSSSNFFLSGSATGNEFFISASNFNVKANGDLTASNANITGDIVANNITAINQGNIAGFTLSSNQLVDSNTGTSLVLKSDGQITGSQVLFTGGKISGSNVEIDVNTLNLDAGSGAIVIDSTNEVITVGNGAIRLDNSFGSESAGLEAINSSVIRVSADGSGNGISNYMSMFYSDATNWGMEVYGDSNTIFFAGEDGGTIKGILAGFDFYGDRIADNATGDTLILRSNGDITGSSVLFDGGTVGGFDITSTQINNSSGTDLILKSNGQITASAAQITGDITATSGQIAGFAISGDVIAGVSYSIDASAGAEGEYFISSSDVKIEGNGDAVFGEYSFALLEDSFGQNGLSRTSAFSNIRVIQGIDANGHGGIFGVATDGSMYFAPISSSLLSGGSWNSFSRELKYNLPNDRWEFETNVLFKDGLTSTGTVSGSQLESSGNTTVKGNLTVLGNTTISGTVDGHIPVTPVASDSNNSNGVVVQDLTFDEFGHTNTIGTVDLDNRYLQLSGGTLTGGVSSNSQISSTKGTIGFANLANAAFLAGTTSNGIGIDSNEIRSKGSNLYIGTIDADKIDFGTGGVNSQVVIASGGNLGVGIDTPSSKLHVSGSSNVLLVEGSGSTLFDVQGSQGQLFSVTDNLTGTLFSVNDISGIPILSVDSDDTVTMGTFGANALVVTGSLVGIGTTSPFNSLNNTGLHIDRGGHTSLMIGDGVNDGGILQSSDNRRRLFLGVNVYDDPSTSWQRWDSGDGAAAIDIHADNETGDFIRFLVDGSGTAFPAERVRITNSGDVGIGTTSPGAHLHIYGAGDEMLRLADNSATGNPYLSFYQTTTRRSFIQHHDTDDTLRIASEYGAIDFRTGTGGSEVQRMIIDSSGNVGIGTASPSAVGSRTTLNISGSAGAAIRLSDGSANTFLDYTDGSGARLSVNAAEPITFRTNSTDRVTINSSGNVGIGTTSPPQTLTVAGNISGSGNLYIDGTTNLGATNVSELNVINTSTPTIDIYDSGNAGGGGATGKIRFQNTAGNAIAIGYTDDETDNSNLLITTNANSTYGGYLGLDTAAISDNVSDIILDARTNVILAPESGSVGIGETNPLVPLHISRDSASGENIALLLDNNNTTAGSEIGILFRSNVGSTNTDFEIFGVANGANDMDLVFQSDGSNERMRIDSSGNVGIGTTSPGNKLHVYKNATTGPITNTTTANAGLRIQDSGANMYIDGNSIVTDAAGYLTTIGSNDFVIGTNNTARIHVDGGGNVGIGTTIPSTKLEVNGTATVTALVETSTRELKENIETLEDQSSIVDSLQPVSYTWKESKEEDFGLIAEDVADIAPHLVHRNEDGKPTGIKYSKLSVLLLDVVQKQNTLINDLNERITKLENERGN